LVETREAAGGWQSHTWCEPAAANDWKGRMIATTTPVGTWSDKCSTRPGRSGLTPVRRVESRGATGSLPVGFRPLVSPASTGYDVPALRQVIHCPAYTCGTQPDFPKPAAQPVTVTVDGVVSATRTTRTRTPAANRPRVPPLNQRATENDRVPCCVWRRHRAYAAAASRGVTTVSLRVVGVVRSQS